MAPCVVKESVDRLRGRATRALATATGDEAVAIREVIDECDRALSHVRKGWKGYPGGRLETSYGMPPFHVLERLRKTFPDLLQDDD
jgi:hypothetical protein